MEMSKLITEYPKIEKHCGEEANANVEYLEDFMKKIN